MARRPMSERWRSGLALLISLVLFGVIVAVGPGSELGALRRILGFDDDPLGAPADVEPGGSYTFLQHQPGDEDEPVTWDPCREIHYEINPKGAPGDNDDAVDLVRDAIAQVQSITGLQFTYDGRTDRRPEWAGELVPVGRSEPVLVSWATADEVEQLKGDVAGIGGAVARSEASGRHRTYFTGGVTFDIDAFDDLEGRNDGERYQRAIVLHELGHLVGLGHVDSHEELMFADNIGRLGYGRGDLNGLVELGKGQCG